MPKDLLIQPAATGNFTLNDHLNGNLTVDAPLSTWNLNSTSTIDGALIVNTYNSHSDIHIHYDRSLGAGFSTASNTQMTSYSWSKF